MPSVHVVGRGRGDAVRASVTTFEPLANVRVDFELPNGMLRPLPTNEAIIARIERVAPGDCRIRLPALDGEHWELRAESPEGDRVSTSSAWVDDRAHCPSPRRAGLEDAVECGGEQSSADAPEAAQLDSAGETVIIPGHRVAEIVRPAGATYLIFVKRLEPKQLVKWST